MDVTLKTSVNIKFEPFKEKFAKFFELMEDKDVRTMVRACHFCPLVANAQMPVPPEGLLTAEYMFIARNPGKVEDEQARCFLPTTPGGRIFHEILERLGLAREQVYISNACFCRTEGDRALKPHEKAICSLWKVLEFERLTKLKYVFTLGNDATRMMVGDSAPSVTYMQGQAVEVNFPALGRTVIVFPLAHPGYILRNYSKYDETLTALDSIREFIGE